MIRIREFFLEFFSILKEYTPKIAYIALAAIIWFGTFIGGATLIMIVFDPLPYGVFVLGTFIVLFVFFIIMFMLTIMRIQEKRSYYG